MLSILTNINCEMKSMKIYSISAATDIQLKVDRNESSFSTNTWEFENQLNAATRIESHGHDI